MAGWLHRPRRPEAENQGGDRRDEVESLLPASVKYPETNRFTPLGSDYEGEDEETDEDIEFLHAIVRAVEGDAPVPIATAAPAPLLLHTPAPSRRIPQPREDELALFRELPSEHDERDTITRHVRLDHVDMADLLDELSTTAAALRRRKAA
jgi:hypothetical protein